MDARSSFLTKDHGLHALGLCRACKALDFRSLSATLSQIHLNNCFDLIERAKTCRLCCFIAQSFRRERDSSVRSLLVGRDIIRNQKVPLCLALNDGWLRATAREGLLAEIRLFSNDDDDDGNAGPEPLKLCSDISQVCLPHSPPHIHSKNKLGCNFPRLSTRTDLAACWVLVARICKQFRVYTLAKLNHCFH